MFYTILRVFVWVSWVFEFCYYISQYYENEQVENIQWKYDIKLIHMLTDVLISVSNF